MTRLASLFLLGMVAMWSAFAANATVAVTGTIVDDSGNPVSGAELMINQAPPAGPVKFTAPPTITGRLVLTVLSNAQGEFSVSGLPSGDYIACAQAASQALLDPCQWASSAPTFTVVEGHMVTGLKVVMARGTMLTIRVSDPLSLLAPVAGPIDFNFDVQVVTVKGLPYSARIQQSAATSRVHAIAIPFDTPVGLRVLASHVAVADQAGNSVSQTASVVSVPAGTAATPIVYTVTGAKAAPGEPVGATGVPQLGSLASGNKSPR